MSELLHLLSNPAHWAFEGISDLAFALPGFLAGRFWLKRHDAKEHPPDKYVTVEMLTEILRMQSSLDDLRRRQRTR